MDPIELATQYCLIPKRHTRIRAEIRKTLNEWRHRGGFIPIIDDVGINMDRTGATRPPGWAHDARDLGLKG